MSLPIPPSARGGVTPPDIEADDLELAPHVMEEARKRTPPVARMGDRELPKQADPTAPLLVVEDLRTHFSLESGTVHAVDGVSFRLDHGEALGIAGESGCGKTTTALSLVRLLPSNASIVSGSVKLYGIDLVPKNDNALRRYRWREIAIVFQGAMNALNPVHRVRDQIAEPLAERMGVSEKEAARQADELLELVGIPKKRGSAYPHELSGGMRQRAMIAMALALRRYRWREISIVFQGAMNALNPVHRLRDQIAEPLMERLNVSDKEARKRAGDLLELVGIPRKRGSAYPHELSGGMRQRAMIAMALACDPAIVIGDEPTTALDVMVQAQILELLEDLRHKLGLSLILITHDLSVIAETCDRVLIMYAGRVAEEGLVDEVFRRPRHPYTQKLLSAFPNIHADRRTLDIIPGSPPDLRHPPPGCRFAPRCAFAMAICSEEVPPETTFDGVRVACHLYPAGSDGTPVTVPTADAIGPTEPLAGAPIDEEPIEVFEE